MAQASARIVRTSSMPVSVVMLLCGVWGFFGWTTPAFADEGWTESLRVEHAAYADAHPDVVVHAPERFHLDEDRPVDIVVFFHGWNGCAQQIALAGRVLCGRKSRQGWDLIGRFDESKVSALFLVPQLAWQKQSGDPGRFSNMGFFSKFMDEVLRALVAKKRLPLVPKTYNLTLIAHSAGFETVLALLKPEQKLNQIRQVILFDAMYAGAIEFFQWQRAEHRRLLSFHRRQGKVWRQHRKLQRLLKGSSGVDESTTIKAVNTSHGRMPIVHLSEALRWLWRDGALPRR